MVLPKTPKACSVKIVSLKKQVAAMEKRKKALSAKPVKKKVAKKVVKKKVAKKKPAKKKKKR